MPPIRLPRFRGRRLPRAAAGYFPLLAVGKSAGSTEAQRGARKNASVIDIQPTPRNTQIIQLRKILLNTVMSRIRSTAATFGMNNEFRRRRRRCSSPSTNEHHASRSKSSRSSGISAHASSGTCTAAAAMMVVLAVTLLGATAPSAVSAGWIDPDTPEEMKATISLVDKTEYELVSV